jgi:hypothetical protein
VRGWAVAPGVVGRGGSRGQLDGWAVAAAGWVATAGRSSTTAGLSTVARSSWENGRAVDRTPVGRQPRAAAGAGSRAVQCS